MALQLPRRTAFFSGQVGLSEALWTATEIAKRGDSESNATFQPFQSGAKLGNRLALSIKPTAQIRATSSCRVGWKGGSRRLRPWKHSWWELPQL